MNNLLIAKLISATMDLIEASNDVSELVSSNGDRDLVIKFHEAVIDAQTAVAIAMPFSNDDFAVFNKYGERQIGNESGLFIHAHMPIDELISLNNHGFIFNCDADANSIELSRLSGSM